MRPTTVIVTGTFAFFNCFKLTSVTVPDQIITTSPYTFTSCKGLTTLTIPDCHQRKLADVGVSLVGGHHRIPRLNQRGEWNVYGRV